MSLDLELNAEVDEVTREVFIAVSEMLGIEEVQPCGSFMVSDIWAQGQECHLDHVNLKDLAENGQCADFLDLSKQSCAVSDSSRVVPTVSIILYFNDVGGIRFPYAAGTDTIAARRGRMVIFQNYDDQQRPQHRASAAHHGMYFEAFAKRVLVMGVLANETPRFTRPVKGLIYCASTSREPLFHDNPSYDCYKTPEQLEEIYGKDSPQAAQARARLAEREAAKPDALAACGEAFALA